MNDFHLQYTIGRVKSHSGMLMILDAADTIEPPVANWEDFVESLYSSASADWIGNCTVIDNPNVAALKLGTQNYKITVDGDVVNHQFKVSKITIEVESTKGQVACPATRTESSNHAIRSFLNAN